MHLTTDMGKALLRSLDKVKCEYPEDPCGTAKNIDVKCDTCRAIDDARTFAFGLDALAARATTEGERP